MFQQHPYEAVRGRYKLVILINREIKVPRGYIESEFYKEFVEILGLQPKNFGSMLLPLDHISKTKYTLGTKFKIFYKSMRLKQGLEPKVQVPLLMVSKSIYRFSFSPPVNPLYGNISRTNNRC